MQHQNCNTRLGDPPKALAEHFIMCPACDGLIDCRDLARVFEREGLVATAGDLAQ